MNPYSALFSNPFDIAVAWASASLWLIAGTLLLRSRNLARHDKTAGYCWSAARAYLYLCAVIAAVFAVGLIFLVWLQALTSFWLIWQLFWFMSVICVFRVLPYFAAVLVGWGLVERRQGRLNNRDILIVMACPLGLALNAAIYFAMELLMVQSS
jgi:hypothetical protein